MHILQGEKTTKDILENKADILEEEEHPTIEKDIDIIIEMWVKNELPKSYYKDGIMDLDKIIENEEFLYEIIGGYLHAKKTTSIHK